MTKEEIELRYLLDRIADVDARAQASPSLSARTAYEQLGRLYRKRVSVLSTGVETKDGEAHPTTEGDL